MSNILLSLATGAALLLYGSASAAEPKQLTFAHSGGPGSLYDLSVKEFTRRLDEALPPGVIAIRIEGEGGVGDSPAVIASIKSGKVAFSLQSSAMPSLSETFGIFDLPFLIRDREQVRRISAAMLEPVLQPEMRKQGLRIIGIWENGFRHITNNVRPIRRPEDLKGLKLRVPSGSKWREKLFRSLGAETVMLALRDVRDAVNDGKIDGQENPLAQIKGARLQEVQRFLTLSDHTYTPAYLLVSDEHFAQLPPDVQRTIERTATEMQPWVYERAIKMESELIDELGEQMEINQVDSRAFIEASRPIYREFVQTVPGGAKLVGLVQELSDAAGPSR